MNGFVDIDYLINSMEEICGTVPLSLDDARSLKNVVLKGLRMSYESVSYLSQQEKENYFKRINMVMSSYQYPSLLVYTMFREFPYLFDANTLTDKRIDLIRGITSSQEMSNLIMDKNIDNSLSDAMIRMLNYIDEVIWDVSFAILYQRDVSLLERCLVGLTQIVPTNVSEYIFNTMYDSYECDLLSDCDYSTVLDNYQTKFDEPGYNSFSKFYDLNDSIVSSSRDLMYRTWKSSFVTGDPISKDIVMTGLNGMGLAFAGNVANFAVITPDEKANLVKDYANQMFAECSDAILHNFISSFIMSTREEILRLTNDNDKVASFARLVSVFQYIVKVGRSLVQNDNVR